MRHAILHSAKVATAIFATSMTPMAVMAQSQVTVKGSVLDQDGIPVIGANVIQKGTTHGVITDFDGNFIIDVPSDATLVISYIGYANQELKPAASLQVIMSEDAVALEEAVVIGYGAVKKSDATGSVVAIKPDKMNRGQTTNAQDMLSGKVAGVNITTGGGTPGSGATIRIRGGSSLNASNDPLIVIDGLPMDNSGIQGVSNPLSTINPNDIESFTVLKDASATAIYGSRASNGVIIITTKKGQAGSRPTIAYDGNFSISTRMNEVDVMTGDEFRAYADILYPGEENAEKRNLLGKANTDWQDEIYKIAFGTDHTMTVTGGLKNMPYRFSLGYTNQDGILKTSEFERYTASVNLSPMFFDEHLKVNINAKGMHVRNRFANGGAIGSALAMDPTQSVYGKGPDYDMFGGYFQWIQGEGDNATYSTLAPKNPVALLMQKDDRSKAKSFLGNVQFDYKFHFLPDLKANLNLAMDYSTGRQDTWTSPQAAENNFWGSESFSESDKINKNLDFYLQYAKSFGQHNLDVMGGYAWQHFHRKGTNHSHTIVESDQLDYNQDWATESYLVSFFGRINYSYKNYLATVTVRQDGSSRFSPDNRWSMFPSFALGWKINDEAFMQDFSNLSDLKLRLGYGITGQQELNMGDYPYLPVYSGSFEGAEMPFYNEDGSISYFPTSRPDAYNPDLKWEQTSTYNAGIDFGFLDNRITGAVDVYYRQTNDLLAVVDIPVGTNFKNRLIKNIGSLENKGIEFSINTKPILTNDLVWDLSFNATYNSNKITKLTSGSGDGYMIPTGGISSGTGAMIQAHAVGQAASAFYVYEQVYDSQGKPVEGLFVDRNEDGLINEDDRYFHKKPAADVLLGLSSKVTYKNWDFGISMRASLGNYVYNDALASRSNVSDLYANSGYWSNRPMDAINQGFQGVTNSFMSDHYVENASFLRIDNITVGYTFKNLFNAGLYGRVYGTVSNPFVFSGYSGLDPEISGGIDYNIYPRPMVSMVGFSLSF